MSVEGEEMTMRERMIAAADRTAYWNDEIDGINNLPELVDAILDAMREPSDGIKETWCEHSFQSYGDGGAYINEDDVKHNLNVVIDAIKAGK